MEYTFKEKQKHYSELKNADAAAADLELLRQKTPNHSFISQYARNPKRYADDILYALLDCSLRDEIRNNRRKLEESNDKPKGDAEDNPEASEETEKRTQKLESALEKEKKKVKATPKTVARKFKNKKNTPK